MDSHLAAYLAGLIDGEGSIQIIRAKRPKPSARGVSYRCNIVVRMTDNAACVMLRAAIGDSFYYRLTAPQAGRRINYLWGVYDTRCEPVIEAIRPYLVVKRDQASILSEFLRVKAQARQSRRFGESYWARLAHLHGELKLLHNTPQIVEDQSVVRVSTDQGGLFDDAPSPRQADSATQTKEIRNGR